MMKTEAVNQQVTKIELPAKWRWAQLDEICEPDIDFRDPHSKPDKEFHYIDISSVDNNRKRIFAPKIILGRDAPSRARQIVRAGDVIVSTTRPNLNAVALVGQDMDNQVCSTGFCVLRAKSNIVPAYLFMFVQTPEFVNSLSNSVKGALYPAVTDKQVRSQIIPLAPLDEQKRISTILNEQMAAVEQARAATESQLELLIKLIDAELRQSLSGPILRTTLNECLEEISKGVGENWKNYRVVGATRAGLAPAKENVGKTPERYKLVDVGTIFYNPMRILLGSIAMVDNDGEVGITSPDYVVFTTRNGILNSRWFYYWLRSLAGDTFIKALTRGAVRERMLFKRLASAEIDLPPWNIQLETADRLRLIGQLKQSIKQQLSMINQLPAAVLRRAFDGEL